MSYSGFPESSSYPKLQTGPRGEKTSQNVAWARAHSPGQILLAFQVGGGGEWPGRRVRWPAGGGVWDEGSGVCGPCLGPGSATHEPGALDQSLFLRQTSPGLCSEDPEPEIRNLYL